MSNKSRRVKKRGARALNKIRAKNMLRGKWRKNNLQTNENATATAKLTKHKIEQEDVPEDVNLARNQPIGPCPDDSEYIKSTISQDSAGTSLPSDATSFSHPLLNNIIPYILRENPAPAKPLVKVEVDCKKNTVPLVESWIINKFLCRCCHAEGDFDSMTSAQGDEPPPDEMLLHVFNIKLCPTVGPGDVLRGICGLCQARLRDAYNFWQQVQSCDQHFTRMYKSNLIQVPNVIFELAAVKEAPDDDKVPEEPNAVQNAKSDKKPMKRKYVRKQKKPDGEPKAKARKLAAKPKVIPKYCMLDGDMYKCIKCDTRSPDYPKIQRHYVCKHVALPCDRCTDTFKTITRLRIHKLESHGIDERYKCNACGKPFNMKYQVKKHMDSYHMMGVKVKCSLCSFETYRKSYMKRHMIKHSGARTYQCQYCSKSFQRPKTLDYHQRIHTGDKRQKCAECGQTFVQKSSLNYHMAKYHPEVRF